MGPRETVSNTSCSGGKVKAPKEVNDSLTVLKLKGFCTRVCINVHKAEIQVQLCLPEGGTSIGDIPASGQQNGCQDREGACPLPVHPFVLVNSLLPAKGT